MDALCQDCDEVIPGGFVAGKSCPRCGGHRIIQIALVADSAVGTETAGVGSDEGQSVVDRVGHLRRDIAAICTPTVSAAERSAARRAMHDIYLNIQGLREACLAEVATGVNVDAAINADPQIARAHDLGNGVKHGTPLDRPPRSGQQPAFGMIWTQQTPDGTWTIDETVTFDGHECSGLTIAKDALAAWERLMIGWGLL